MTQLVRIKPGSDIEEAHMRNRQLIARWAFEMSSDNHAVEMIRRDGKSYIRVNDYEELRRMFGRMLAEIQRIKSTGDYEAARQLVERLAVRVPQELHSEVLERYSRLNLAPYKGFVNPVYTAVRNAAGEITDVKVSYDEEFTGQMMRYGRQYGSFKD
jgi:dipeptidyl-peptidase-3